MKKNQPDNGKVMLGVHVQEDLKKKVANAAIENRRTLSAETELRLEKSFEQVDLQSSEKA